MRACLCGYLLPLTAGKTETVKDLGHALGRHVIVTNCSEAFGVDNLSRLFLGAAAVGAWYAAPGGARNNRENVCVLAVCAVAHSRRLVCCFSCVVSFFLFLLAGSTWTSLTA